MKTGDIVFHQEYGVGKIKFIDGLAYLVYYYYWWSYAEDLKLISSVRTLIERRQHG